MNGDDDLCVEKEEEDDRVQPVVKMRVKASRTSEVKLLLLGYKLIKQYISFVTNFAIGLRSR